MGKGEYGGGHSKTDTSRDTGDSTSKVSEAWHDARNDAAKETGWGVPSDRHNSSSKSESSGSNNSGK